MAQIPDTKVPLVRSRKLYSSHSLALLGIAIFALALLVRVAVIAIVGSNAYPLTQWTESGLIAQNLLAGRGFTYDFFGLRVEQPLQSFMPPLFVWLLYVCLRFSAQPALTLALVHAVLSSLTAVAIFLLAAQLSGRKAVALLSGLGVAVYPVMVVMVTMPISLTLHLAVLAWALVFTALLAPKPKWPLALAAGALWGLLVLGRPAIVAFLPLVLLWLWLNRRTRRDWLKLSGLILVAATLVLLPWTIRNYRIHGRLILVSTNGGTAFWNGNSPFSTGTGQLVYTEKVDQYLGRPHDPNQPPVVQMQPYPLPPDLQVQVATISEIELDRRQFQAGRAFIRQQPQAWLALMGQKVVGFLWFRRDINARFNATWAAYYQRLYVALLILTIAGLAVSTRRWRRYSLLYLLFVFYTAIHVAYNVDSRYRWEIEPFFLIFAALFVVEVYDRTSVARKRRTSGSVASVSANSESRSSP